MTTNTENAFLRLKFRKFNGYPRCSYTLTKFEGEIQVSLSKNLRRNTKDDREKSD